MRIEKWLRYLLVGGLFAVPFIPLIVSTSLFFPYITGKAFAFRILVEILLAGWLILILVDRRFRPRGGLVLYSVLALTIILSLAAIFGVNPYQSFWSNFERMEGLVSYLHLLAYFLIVGSVFTTEKIWKSFFHVSLAASVLVAIYALFQLVGKLAITQGGVRVEATLGNASYLAVYMLIHVFLAAWLWYENRRYRWLGLFYGPVILLELFVLYNTATRGAILGLIGGILLTAFLVAILNREQKTVRRVSLGVLAAVILFIAGFLAVKDSSLVKNSPVLSRFADISLVEATTESRLTIWRMSWRGFLERPILGWGPENFIVVFNKYYEPKLWRQEPWFDRSHNIFIDWLAQAGVLGFLAYLSLFAAGLYYLWRYGRDTVTKSLFTGLLVAYSIHNFFVFDNLTSLLLFFSLLAYFHCLKTNQVGQGTLPRANPVRLDPPRLALSGAVIIAAAASIYWVNIRPMTAARNIILALGAPSFEERLNYFEKVFAADTFGSREAVEHVIRAAHQLVQNQAVSPELKLEITGLALRTVSEQAEKSPDEARLRLLAGLLLNKLDRPAEAVRYLEEAKYLSPRKQLLLFELARVYFGVGEKEKALGVAQDAFLSDNNYQEARVFYSLMLIANGKFAEAENLWPEDGSPADERLINVYAEAGRYREVLRLWQKKVEAEPDNVQHRFSLAAAYFVNNERARAIAELEEAARIDPTVKEQADFVVREIRAGRNPITN